jgi:hypothetical protein
MGDAFYKQLTRNTLCIAFRVARRWPSPAGPAAAAASGGSFARRRTLVLKLPLMLRRVAASPRFVFS